MPKNSRRWPQIKICKKANPLQNSTLHKNTCDQSQKISFLYSTRPTGNCSRFLFWLTKSAYLVSSKLSENLLSNWGYCPLHHWLPWGAIYFTYSPSRRQCRFRWFMNWRCESHTKEVAHLTCLRAEKPRNVQVDDKPVHPPCLSLQQRWFGILGQIHVLLGFAQIHHSLQGCTGQHFFASGRGNVALQINWVQI